MNIDVKQHGEEPFRHPSYVISDDVYIQWNSFRNRNESWSENYVVVYRDLPNGRREVLAQIKLQTGKRYTDDLKVHKKLYKVHFQRERDVQ